MFMRRILKAVSCFLTGVLVLICGALTVSAEEAVLNGANLSFFPPEGWSVVYEGNMSDSALDVIGKTSSTVRAEFEECGGYLCGANPNRTIEVYVTRTSDNISERIFNSQTGNYQLITDYLNAPAAHNYIRNGNKITVVRTAERVLLENCTFNAVEYTTEKGCGICYSTVVNGDYISVDFRRASGESFSDSEKILILNSISTAKALVIEEKETLDLKQWIILGGLALLLMILVTAIIIKVNKNKG